jgi:hypothetical protein
MLSGEYIKCWVQTHQFVRGQSIIPPGARNSLEQRNFLSAAAGKNIPNGIAARYCRDDASQRRFR